MSLSISAGCSCRGIEVLSDDSWAQRRFELGPAFEDWRDGVVSIGKEFREKEDLVPVWMDKCCTERPGQMLFEPSAEPTLFAIVVFTVVCLHSLASMRRRREHVVIQSRSLEKLLLDGSLALMFMWFVLSLIGCGPTASRGFLLFVYLVLLPASMSGYIVSNIKLAFVYQWNKQKLKCDTRSDECDLSKIEWFLKNKWLIDDRTLYAFRVVVLAVGVLLTAMAATSPSSGVSGDQLYSSVRCQWWQLPEQYTTVAPSDPLCACSDYRFSRSATDFSSCTLALDNYCAAADPLTNDTSLCTSCKADFEGVSEDKASSDSFKLSNKCKKALTNMYSYVTCPYTAEAPFFQSCRYGIAADTLARGLTTAFLSLLLAAVLMMVWLVMPVRDRYGARNEFLLWAFGFVPLLLLAMLGVQSDGLFRAFAEPVDDYHLSYLFILLAAIWNCLCVCVYPIVLVQLVKDVEVQPGQHDAAAGAANTYMSRELEADRENLVICLQSEFLRNLYMDFAAREFTAENIKFLIDMVDFANAIDEMPTTKVAREAIRIYSMYIATNAPLQVNISAKTREGVTQFIERSGENGAPAFESRAEVLEWFKPAVQTVVTLVVTDSWPRFKQSKVYKKEFLLLLESNRTIEEVSKRGSTLNFADRASTMGRHSRAVELTIRPSTASPHAATQPSPQASKAAAQDKGRAMTREDILQRPCAHLMLPTC